MSAVEKRRISLKEGLKMRGPLFLGLFCYGESVK